MINKFSELGTQHFNGTTNEDVVCSGNNAARWVIALADGVTSCKMARKGAEIACRALTNLLLQKGDFFLDCEKEKTAKHIIAHIEHELKQHATENNKLLSEYSSTIAGILLDKRSRRVMSISLGDSLIVYTEDRRCNMLSIPADSVEGCPTTTTINAWKLMEIQVMDANILDSVVICSDGAWHHMIKTNRLRQNIKTMIIDMKYEKLSEFLKMQNCRDDYSFISLDICKLTGRFVA